MIINSSVKSQIRALALALLAATTLTTGDAAARDKAGIHPKSVNIYILNDETLNAFVAGGQNVFIHTGMITTLKSPNELKGVIAHETGHISGSHLARGPEAMAKAEIPMIIGMLAGIAAIAAGAPDLGLGLLIGAQSFAQREFLAYSRTQESAADQAGVWPVRWARPAPTWSWTSFAGAWDACPRVPSTITMPG